jgi:SAM-dependent methyltransferase
MKKHFCPACKNDNAQLRGEKSGSTIWICSSCRTLFTIRNTTEVFDYADYYNEGNFIVPEFINQRLDQIVQQFTPYRQNNRLLDVGCGAGHLLRATMRAGWQSEGVEVSKSSVDYLRSQGFNVFHGFLETANYPDNLFDIVTISELIEHVSEPEKLLCEIARILRPGGLLWGTTPNGNGISAMLLGIKWTCVAPPEHLNLFSPKGMKILLNKAGFSKIRIQTLGTNPFEIMLVLSKKNAFETKNTSEVVEFNRVETSYRLNQALSETPSRQAVKNLLNGVLNVTGFGDSLKIWAVK